MAGTLRDCRSGVEVAQQPFQADLDLAETRQQVCLAVDLRSNLRHADEVGQARLELLTGHALVGRVQRLVEVLEEGVDLLGELLRLRLVAEEDGADVDDVGGTGHLGELLVGHADLLVHRPAEAVDDDVDVARRTLDVDVFHDAVGVDSLGAEDGVVLVGHARSFHLWSRPDALTLMCTKGSRKALCAHQSILLACQVAGADINQHATY